MLWCRLAYPVWGIQGRPWNALVSASRAGMRWRVAVARQERIAQNSSAPAVDRRQPEILMRINRPWRLVPDCYLMSDSVPRFRRWPEMLAVARACRAASLSQPRRDA